MVETGGILVKCKICEKDSKHIFSAKILQKYDGIKYYHCSCCGFLQTEEPYWLEEAYVDAIAKLDTGIMERNISLSKIASSIIYFLFDKTGTFLDYGGGHGIFTRMMRDIGFDFYWYDIHAKNLVAKGFEYSNSIKNIELLTAIECFEHFVDPIKEIENILAISKNILFTTQLLPQPVPAPKDWWYYCLQTGQHISFYSKKTLDFIAQKYGLNVYTWGGNHLLTKKQVSNFVFNKIMQYRKGLLFNYVKNRMKSKTGSDNESFI